MAFSPFLRTGRFRGFVSYSFVRDMYMPPRKKIITDIVPGATEDTISTVTWETRSDEPVSFTVPEHVSIPPVAQINVQDLMAALIAAREVNKPNPEDTELHKLTLVRTVAIGFAVNDPRTGVVKKHSLRRKGESVMLTKNQILDLKDKYPKFFKKGYLSAPSVLEDSPNTVGNIETFIEGISFEEIDPRVKAMDSLPTLFDIFHHIENRRFVHQDHNGRPLVERVGDDTVLTMGEVELPPKVRALEAAVKARIEQLSNTKVVLDS